MGIKPFIAALLFEALILFAPLVSYAQLSNNLLHFLSDSCRPVPGNKKTLTASELIKIFGYAKDFATPEIYKELDSLAALAFNYTLHDKNEDSCALILYQLTNYTVNVENYQACTKYCNEALKKMQGKQKYKGQISVCIMIKGANYSRLGNYEESARYLGFYIDSAKAAKDSIIVAECYSALTTPYRILNLYALAFSSCDSSIAYFKNCGSTHQQELEDVYLVKYFTALFIYQSTRNTGYLKIAQQLAEESTKRKKRNSLFAFYPIEMAYCEKNYAKTISLCDSFLADIAIKKAPQSTYNINYLKAYKGEVLVKMGKNAEGILLLKDVLQFYSSVNNSSYSYLPMSMYSKYLYMGYKNEKNWEQAFYYLEMYKAYSDSLNIIGNRGAMFMAEQEYNYAKKETEVSELQTTAIIHRKEKNLAIAITIISILSLIVVAIMLINRYRKLKLKEQLAENEAAFKIEKLRISTQLQIAELEEKSQLIKQEEQQRMGMELHDNLGGTMAAISLKLQNKIRASDDILLKEWLQDIYALINEAYNETRNRSHEWYNKLNAEAGLTCARQITALLETGLPDNYNKEILIDNEVLNHTSLNTRIEILYIIKEAVANIIKHADAKKICILIYEDVPGIILSIIDDGKGFNQPKNNMGFGLTSIKNRAISIGAVADFISSKDGTEIKVTIPL